MYGLSNHENYGKARGQLDRSDLRYVQCRTLKEHNEKIMHITFLNCTLQSAQQTASASGEYKQDK